ncbi:MAG: hypothetical protein H0Z18_03255 [Thermococcus sp.]|uniref:hypothetical protein n=1 Tax=Thermococcus sp. TaxID=35749 RepID=UPI001DFDF101|nr:hypothetical protein [Thermococcus sp.]MBO8174258.1 hypothetical protein [Thermococcus sp.]
MEWKSILVGFILGALIAIPIGLAHSGADFDDEKVFRGPTWGWGMHGGMMSYGMMYEQHEEMEEEMEPIMEKYMSEGWKEMHEFCERAMGIEEDEE